MASTTSGIERRSENNSPAPAKLFPQWREVEQDFWLDMFESYSETLLNQVPEDNSELNRVFLSAGSQEAYFTEKIRIAARLADEATKEMIYRFERQKPLRNQRRSSGGGSGGKAKKKTRRSW